MSLTEATKSFEFLLSESPGNRSRENGVLNAAQDLAAGTVLGRILSAGAATAVGTPAGTGTITIGAAIGKFTQEGAYTLRCVAASAGAGTFALIAPDGTHVAMNTASGMITVGGGATTSDHLTVTIADGTPDFGAGDSWTVTVTGGDYEQLDTSATTGEQIAAGVLCTATDATSADQDIVVIARTAEVSADLLTWPAGITDANKAFATARLAARGITLR